MFCSSAAIYYARRVLRRPIPSLRDVASKTIEISPAVKRQNRPAFILPNQLAKVVNVCETTSFEYEVHERLDARVIEHQASCAYLLKDAVLNDGMLFGPHGYGKHVLSYKKHAISPELSIEERPSALYSSLFGNVYWGHWLKDDCSTYLIASQLAAPVSVDRTPFLQQPDYEKLLGMHGERKNATLFKELWVFDDFAQNESRRQRYIQMRQKILQSIGMENPSKHAGIYIARGESGARRLLLNEEQVIAFFQSCGFIIIDTLNYSVDDIVRACAGARVVAGVEGSSLSHGFMLQEEGDSMLVLNPPNRFNNIYKDVSDCKGLNYATVVGDLKGSDFTIDIAELEKTLALLPAA